MTIPPKRPVVLDLETYNGNPALAQLAKRLMQWANFTNDRDRFCTPSDPLALSVGTTPLTRTEVSGGSETKQLGVAWIPPTLGPQTQIKVWLYVVRSSVNATAEFKLTSRRTGRVQTVTLAAGAAGEAWESAVVDAEGGDAFALSLTSTHADAVSVWGACAWWHQASIVGATVDAYQKVTLQGAASDAAFSTYLLRWLARRANQFALERPRPAFAKWWATWKGTGGVNLGRYRVLIGPGITSITVHLLVRVATDPGVTAKVNATLDDGSSTYTAATTGIAVSANYAWPAALTITFPVSTQARTMELRLDGDGAAGEYRVASVAAWENAAADADILPAGESVPANFAAMSDESLSSRHAIVSPGSAGFAQLLGSMAWCWKNRGLRSLVSDCRWDGVTAYRGEASPPDPLVEPDAFAYVAYSVHARYRVKVSPGDGVAVWREGVEFFSDVLATTPGRVVRVTDDLSDPFDAPRAATVGETRWSENPSPQAYLAGVHEFTAREYAPNPLIDHFWESRGVGFQFEELPLATTGGGTAR
jgi:hypothetical protein